MFKSLGKGDDLEMPPPSKKKEPKKKKKLQPLPERSSDEVQYFDEAFSFDDDDEEEVEGEQESRRRRVLFNYQKLQTLKMDVGKGEKFSDAASTPLTLQDQEVHMNVVAGTIETSTTMTFFNSHDKVLEGQLIFPLPKDTAIHGYGMDINGVMVDAVPVPKEKARIAFEKTVREKGPAISVAEKVDPYANSFKTSVYPMPAKGTRTVKVVTLNQMIDDVHHKLFFTPIQKPASLKSFKFTFSSSIPGVQVLVRRSSGAMEPVTDFSKSLAATEDFEGILLVVPKEKGTGATVVIEKDPDSGYHYFSATFSNIKPLKKLDNEKKEKIKTASIFFDVSSSRRFCEWKEELKLIKGFMEENNTCKIDFYEFSNTIHQKKTFKKFEELLKHVESIQFDGGTCIPFKEMSFGICKTDIILLLSDGISNYGPDLESELFNMKFGPPIYCISSSSNSAYIMMRYLSEKSGGGYFDVTELEISEILKKIGIEQFGIKNILYDPFRTSEVFSTPLINNSISVYGRLLESKGYIQLDFGENQIYQADINLIEDDDNNSLIRTTIRTLWAQRKIQQLSIFSSKNQKEIERIGMKFGIITSQTSLIILSDLSQYQKYEIIPPRQLKEIRKGYLNMISETEKNEENRRKQKIKNVITKWKRRIDWHKKDFKPKPKKKMEMKKKKECCRRRCCRRCCAEEDDSSRFFGGDSSSDCEKEDDDDDDDSDECDDSDSSSDEESEEEEKKKKKKKKKGGDSSDESEEEEKKKKKKKKKGGGKSSSSSINIKAYIPGSKYLDAIKNSRNKYKEYLNQKINEGFEESPSFFLDCSDYFISILKEIDLGVRILSNISELELSNVQLLRIIGYKLDQTEKYEESIQIFEKVLKLKPEEPQSYRDLALVIERLGDYPRAAKLLYKVIGGNWDSRFDEIELTATIELNHVLENIKNISERNNLIKELGIEKELIYHMDCDIRISMAWDTDMTDIDLHVFDPNGFHCFYGDKNTPSGGFISRDFTAGYGPEEFMQKKVWKNGIFKITAKYFASHQQSLTGGTTILTTFFTHYLQPNEERKLVTIRLTTNKEDIEICDIKFKM